MENPKIPETLTEIPFDNPLQAAFGDSDFSNLREDRSESVFVSAVNVVETSGVISADKMGDCEEKCGNASEMEPVFVSEVNVLENSNVIGADKMVEFEEKCGNASEFESVFASEVNVVENCGVAGADIIVDPEEKCGNADKCETFVCFDNGIDRENHEKIDDEDVSAEQSQDENIEQDEHTVEEAKNAMDLNENEQSFCKGDLVWVMNKSGSWFPGQICDPLDAKRHFTKTKDQNTLFVRYFGNEKKIWCCPSQLKHFHENFEHMSTHNKSKNFVVALEKAVNEFSKQIKSKMICMCFPEESSSLNKSFKNSVSEFEFEPIQFLANLKNLTSAGSMPGKLEYAVVKSRLWTYHHFLGHKNIPLRDLYDLDEQRSNGPNSPVSSEKGKEEEGNFSDEPMDVVLEEKGSDLLRERKKSKYLSPPYTDLESGRTVFQKCKPKISKISDENTDTVKYSAKKSQPLKKPVDPSKYLESLNKSSANLLSELHIAAIDCLYPHQNDCFDSIVSVFSMFRKSIYHDESNNLISNDNLDDQKDVLDPSKTDVKPRQKKKKKEVTTAPVPGPVQDLNGNGVMLNFALEGKPEPKKRKRKEKTKLEVPVLNGNCVKPISLVVDLHIDSQLNKNGQETATPLDLNTNIPLGVVIVDVNAGSFFPENGLLAFEGKSAPKKRKKKEQTVFIDFQNSGIPDLNGNSVENNFSNLNPEKKRRRKGEGTSGTKIKPVWINREALNNTTLLLNFSSDNPIPSKELLITTFSKFESFKETETQIFENSNSAHVVFSTNSDAVEAVKFLEATNPFGPSLVSHQFQHLSASSEGIPPPILQMEAVKKITITPSKIQNNPVNSDTPPLSIIRQNLEIMTSMLEKSGDKLSADMKAKLDGDIKSLLNKVSTMTG